MWFCHESRVVIPTRPAHQKLFCQKVTLAAAMKSRIHIIGGYDRCGFPIGCVVYSYGNPTEGSHYYTYLAPCPFPDPYCITEKNTNLIQSTSEQIPLWNPTLHRNGFPVVIQIMDPQQLRKAFQLMYNSDAITITFEKTQIQDKIRISCANKSIETNVSVSVLVKGRWMCKQNHEYVLHNYYKTCYVVIPVVGSIVCNIVRVSDKGLGIQFNQGPVVFLDTKFDPTPMLENRHSSYNIDFPCGKSATVKKA